MPDQEPMQAEEAVGSLTEPESRKARDLRRKTDEWIEKNPEKIVVVVLVPLPRFAFSGFF